jgi:hypothetical protein
MALKPTTEIQRRVEDQQYRSGRRVGQAWGQRLRPWFAPVRWYLRRRRGS